MAAGRGKRESATYDRLMYPGPEPRVPVNRLRIRDWPTLHALEAEILPLRMEQGLPHEALALTFEGYLSIHRHLFQDLYEWAGSLRPYTTSRNPGAPFAAPENIRPWMQKQFELLRSREYLRGLGLSAFAPALASVANELNAAHPFIDGNGRVLRLWLQIVSEQAGFDLTLDRRHATAWNESSRIGVLTGNCEPLIILLLGNLTAIAH
jgi:cell filamentation protein